MKKEIFIVFSFCIISIVIIGYFAYDKVTKQSVRFNSVSSNNLSAITLYDSTSEKVFLKESLGKSLILILFNSSCDICHAEATQIKNKLGLLKTARLIFVSIEPSKDIEKFSLSTKLKNEDNVFFYRIDPEMVSNLFGSAGVPQINIYDSNYALIKEFDGEIKVSAVASYLESSK
jgi:hypothetical protein